jgi:hypothetical protein
MPFRAPISYHLDLCRYWLVKRGGRAMPSRSDLDPGEIPALLPHLMIVDKVDGRFRWRLVGTSAVLEVGRDPTGTIVGSYDSTPESAAAARAIYERVFTTAHPIFATGEFKVKSGAVINMSLLTLPLSDDGATVNMAVSTLIARIDFGLAASADWLKGRPVKLRDVVDVAASDDLEKRCLDWERYCGDQRRTTRGVADGA